MRKLIASETRLSTGGLEEVRMRSPNGEQAERKAILRALTSCVAALFLTLVVFSGISGHVSAATKNVRVTITQIVLKDPSTDPADSGSAADFYVQVYVGRQMQSSPQTAHQNDNNVSSSDTGMPMQFDFVVTYNTAKPWITVVVEVWDDDGSGDNVCDISRRVSATPRELGTERSLILSLDLSSMTWTGDDGYNDGSGGAADTQTGYSDGHEWPDSAATQIDVRIWFGISIFS